MPSSASARGSPRRTACGRRRRRAACRARRCRPCCRRARRAARMPASAAAHDLLGTAVAVDVRRVDERHARVDRGADRRDRVVVARRAPLVAAERPRAERELRDLRPVVRGGVRASWSLSSWGQVKSPSSCGEARADEHGDVAEDRRRERHHRPAALVVQRVRADHDERADRVRRRRSRRARRRRASRGPARRRARRAPRCRAT